MSQRKGRMGGTPQNNMERVFESIRRGGFKLKHVDTNDKTRYNRNNFKDYKLKRMDRKRIFAELLRGVRLKHVETNDKTKLKLERGFKLRKNTHKKLFEEIKRGNFNLKKTPKINDRSAPMFERYGKVPIPQALLKDVAKAQGKNKLHHVNTVDKSVPKIEKDVKIHKIDRKPFLGEVKEGIHLNHVETCDKAKPQIPRNFHLTKVDRAPKQRMDDKRRLDLEKGKGVKAGQSSSRASKFI